MLWQYFQQTYLHRRSTHHSKTRFLLFSLLSQWSRWRSDFTGTTEIRKLCRNFVDQRPNTDSDQTQCKNVVSNSRNTTNDSPIENLIRIWSAKIKRNILWFSFDLVFLLVCWTQTRCSATTILFYRAKFLCLGTHITQEFMAQTEESKKLYGIVVSLFRKKS